MANGSFPFRSVWLDWPYKDAHVPTGQAVTFAGSWLFSAPEAPSGGPVTFGAAGTGVETGYGGSGFPENLLVPYVAGITAGQLLVVEVLTNTAGGSGAAVLPAPAGWYAHPNNGLLLPGGADRATLFAFIKPAVGGESGNLSITMPADGAGGFQGGAWCRMYRFPGGNTTGSAWSDFAESGGSATGSDASVEYAAVTSTGADRMAVVLIGLDGSNSVADIGALTQPVASYNSSERQLSIQTATVGVGSISGGSAALGGAEPWASLSFVIKGAAAEAGATGTVVASLGALTVAATGAERFSGTASASLGSFTVASSGAERFVGAAAASLGAFGVVASGAERFLGTSSASLGGFTCVASGTVGVVSGDVTGTVIASLGAFTVASSGVERFRGPAAASLGAFGVTASGAERFRGPVVASLGAFACSGTGAERFRGPAAASLGAFTAAASGFVGRTSGVVEASFGAFSCISAGEIAAPVLQVERRGGGTWFAAVESAWAARAANDGWASHVHEAPFAAASANPGWGVQDAQCNCWLAEASSHAWRAEAA